MTAYGTAFELAAAAAAMLLKEQVPTLNIQYILRGLTTRMTESDVRDFVGAIKRAADDADIDIPSLDGSKSVEHLVTKILVTFPVESEPEGDEASDKLDDNTTRIAPNFWVVPSEVKRVEWRPALHANPDIARCAVIMKDDTRYDVDQGVELTREALRIGLEKEQAHRAATEPKVVTLDDGISPRVSAKEVLGGVSADEVLSIDDSDPDSTTIYSRGRSPITVDFTADEVREKLGLIKPVEKIDANPHPSVNENGNLWDNLSAPVCDKTREPDTPPTDPTDDELSPLAYALAYDAAKDFEPRWQFTVHEWNHFAEGAARVILEHYASLFEKAATSQVRTIDKFSARMIAQVFSNADELLARYEGNLDESD